jgi:hypothetical protein
MREFRVPVNLDKQHNTPVERVGGSHVSQRWTLILKHTKTIQLEAVSAYLNREMAFDNSMYECLSEWLVCSVKSGIWVLTLSSVL